MNTRTLARMLERIETPIRMPNPKLWPDCPLCGLDVVRCECDPDDYAKAVYEKEASK